MKAKFKHTNIVAKDWKKLARFYKDVFGCTPVPPERNHSGQWLDDGVGVKNARISGMHLRLPGFGDNGPTLEIFTYAEAEENAPSRSHRLGLRHIAFEVEDVEAAYHQVLSKGGQKIGGIVSREVPGAGLLVFAYVTDPEGNIIELQNWRQT